MFTFITVGAMAMGSTAVSTVVIIAVVGIVAGESFFGYNHYK